MNKEVGSLIRYQEQALACNRRYLYALTVVDDPTPAYATGRAHGYPEVAALQQPDNPTAGVNLGAAV